MKAASIRGVAKVLPLFTCSKCGRVAAGDGEVTVNFDGVENLSRQVDRLGEHRNLIPVGWSSNGNAGVTCSTCTGA